MGCQGRGGRLASRFTPLGKFPEGLPPKQSRDMICRIFLGCEAGFGSCISSEGELFDSRFIGLQQQPLQEVPQQHLRAPQVESEQSASVLKEFIKRKPIKSASEDTSRNQQATRSRSTRCPGGASRSVNESCESFNGYFSCESKVCI